MPSHYPEEGVLMPSRLHTAVITAVVLILSFAPITRADLAFPKPRFDVGEVRSGAPLVQKFEFRNTGPDEVKILDLKASCGCAQPTLEKRTFGPGESGSITLEVETLTQSPGDHTWLVRVYYLDGTGQHDVGLRVAGRVVAEVTMQPSSLTLFTETSAEHEITLTDLRDRPLKITSLESSTPNLKATLKKEGQDGAGHRTFSITLNATAEFKPGRHEELVFVGTDDPSYRVLKVPVTVVKRPKGSVSSAPTTVHLVAATGQTVPSRVVLLKAQGDEAVVIDHVETGDEAIRCTFASGPGNMATLKVTVDRSKIGPAGLHSAVHVHVSKPNAEVLALPVTCALE
jgi:hypothetical protein